MSIVRSALHQSKRVWDIGSSSPFQGDDVGSIPTARTSCSLPLMAGDLTFNQETTDRNRQGAPPTADPPARSGAFEASQDRSTRSSADNARAPGSSDLSYGSQGRFEAGTSDHFAMPP